MSHDQVELDTSVGYVLKQAAAALRGSMESALAPLGLTVSQYSCLELLRQRPGLSASDLARGTFVTRQSMQTLLQGLQERQLLARSDRPERGRSLPTELTSDGLLAVEEASRVVAGVEGRMLAGLTPAARRQLLDALASCVAALAGEA